MIEFPAFQFQQNPAPAVKCPLLQGGGRMVIIWMTNSFYDTDWKEIDEPHV